MNQGELISATPIVRINLLLVNAAGTLINLINLPTSLTDETA